MTKLKQLTQKIHELLKGGELDPMELKEGSYVQLNGIPTDIRIIRVYPNDSLYVSFRDGSCSHISADEYTLSGSPIREAEILRALHEYRENITINGEGCFVDLTDLLHGMCEYVDPNIFWQLGKPLPEQSEQTIDFLYEILVK